MFARYPFDVFDEFLAGALSGSSCLPHAPLLSGYDELKTLSYQISLFGPISADVRYYEIMAVSGHVTLSMTQKYCETFRRRDMADTAFLRLNGAKIEQNLTNRPERFVNKLSKTLK